MIQEDITESNVSGGSGSSLNVRPSLSLAGNIYPVVSWVRGSYFENNSDPYSFIYYSYMSTRRGPAWGTINSFGWQAQYVNNNSAIGTTAEKTVIVWSEKNYGVISTKWVRRTGTSYSTPQSLSNTGIQTQVAYGVDYTFMPAIVLSNSSVPAYFVKATTNFSTGLSKTASLSKSNDKTSMITYGRNGVVSINGIEFVFNIGDILVEGSTIKFIEKPDTLLYSTAKELNKSTRTEDFELNSSSTLLFTNFYQVVKKANSDTALSETDAVNFKVELVNSATGTVVGTFDNISYNKNNLAKYANIDYQIDCKGITHGEYYLRLVTEVFGDAHFTLGNIVTDDMLLAKKNYNKFNLTENEVPESYNLAQNFPNPFNPTTKISWQSPVASWQTLKVYDILGNEVATLVNEFREAGKYEVSFDANKLSSGVYIYKLQAGSFVSTKKMLLLK